MSAKTRRRQRRPQRRGGQREEQPTQSLAFRVGRVLFGGVLAFMALDNLRSVSERVEYARAQGAPLPSVTVPSVSAALLAGGVGLAAWKYPRLAGAAVASFFVGVTPVMHDFWNRDGEERQQQQVQFLKNTALLGAALAFLRFGESQRNR